MKNTFHATRFAPSPTGPLHFGSLVCALVSYIYAKQRGAQWFLRIEDVDKQRCDDRYSEDIKQCLQRHGLQWDKEPIYQQQQERTYQVYLQRLIHKQLIYACTCTRKAVRQRSEFYDNHCRAYQHPFENNALRLKVDMDDFTFQDLHYAQVQADRFEQARLMLNEDPVLQRADGQYNYNLAVVVDDIEQAIDVVIRGADLLELVPLHRYLFQAFNAKVPAFLHIPLAVHQPGEKFAKQSFSPAIDSQMAPENIKSALVFMGMDKKQILKTDDLGQLITWALNHWELAMLPKHKEIRVQLTNNVYSIDESLINS